MRPAADFALRTGAAFVAALVLSPVFGMLFPGEQFHRVMTRTFQGALLVALVVRRGPAREWPAKFRAMGFRGPERRRRVLLGAGVGVVSMALLLLVSWGLGGRTAASGDHRLALVVHLLAAAGTGAAVGLAEEIFFRGYLKDAIGGLSSAFLYAVVHFIAPLGKSAPAGEGYDPLLAVKRLHELNAWTDPQRALMGIPCLLVFGLALNRLRERTGTLYVGMGLHAGVVFVLASYGRFLSFKSKAPQGLEDLLLDLGLRKDLAEYLCRDGSWIYGGGFARDGLLPLLALLLLLLASYRAPLPPWARA